jgi:type II secretory pathway pseudopilin PulG
MGRRPRGGKATGFTLLELMGVLALMAMLAAVLAPATARRFQRARAEKESHALATLGDGLLRVAREKQSIPGPQSWVPELALHLGWSPDEVLYVDRQNGTNTRVLLVHPGFTPGDAAASGALWVHNSDSVSTVTNARVLLLSSLRPDLSLPVVSGVAASAQSFEVLWNWSLNPETRAAPTGWPASWSGQGAALRLHRINFRPEFKRVTLSNLHYPGVAPAIQWNGGLLTPLTGSATFETWCLQGTSLRLFQHEPAGGVLQLSHTVLEAVNFIYSSNRWLLP